MGLRATFMGKLQIHQRADMAADPGKNLLCWTENMTLQIYRLSEFS